MLPKRLVRGVSPAWANSVNSNIWKPMKMEPNRATTKVQKRNPPMFPRWIAASASTIARLLISRTNVLMVVTGMLRISSCGPERDRFR